MQRLASWAIAGLIAAALILPAPAQSKKKLDDLADIGHRGVGSGLNFYSMEKEIALGKMLAQQVESTERIMHDPVLNEYVNRVAQNLVRHSDAHFPLTVKIVDSKVINAEALPGGYFFVNSGLILAANNESEMAGPMAHEIAHIADRDGTRQMTKAELVNYATLPLWFVGGIGGFVGRTVAGLAIPMTFLKFDRSIEAKADFLGLEYMYEAGYDPQSFVRFFQQIEAENKRHPGFIARSFETHPPTANRIKAAENEIDTVLPAKKQYVLDTSEFERMKARLARLEQAYSMTNPHGPNRPSLRHPERNGQAPKRPTLKRRPH